MIFQKKEKLLIFFGLHLLPVCSANPHVPVFDRRFFIERPLPDFLENTSPFKFLFKPLERFVDGFVFLNVYYDHIQSYIQNGVQR